MYTGTADHSLTAELVSLVDVPVVASGDVTLACTRADACSRRRAPRRSWSVAARRGTRGRSREIVDGDDAEPSREEVAAELVLFVRETVRELGERRASGFLKKFYGWYLGHGRFPKEFKQELAPARLDRRGRAPAARRSAGRARDRRAARGGGAVGCRADARAARLDLRRRLELSPRRTAGERGRDAEPDVDRAR